MPVVSLMSFELGPAAILMATADLLRCSLFGNKKRSSLFSQNTRLQTGLQPGLDNLMIFQIFVLFIQKLHLNTYACGVYIK